MKDKFARLLPVPLRWVLALALANMAVMAAIDGLSWAGDSLSYRDAIPNILARGYDQYRTPLYPMLMWMCECVAGERFFLHLLMVVQCAVFYASVAALWHLLRGVSRSSAAATAGAAFYALAPAFPHYALSFITDSMAVSLTVFLLLFAWLLTRPGAGRGAAAGFAAALMLMLSLRPSLAAVLPAVAVFAGALIYYKYGRAKLLAWLCLAAMAPAAAQVGLMWRATGVATPSQVGADNMLYIAVTSGAATPDMAPNPRVALAMDSMLIYQRGPGGLAANGWLIMGQAHVASRDGGVAAVMDVCRRAGAPWVGLDQRLAASATDYHAFMHTPTVRSATPHTCAYASAVTAWAFPWARFWMVYVALLLGAAGVAWRWVRSRRMPVLPVFALLTAAGIVAGAVIFAPDHFDRLSLPALPALMLLAARAVPALRGRFAR